MPRPRGFDTDAALDRAVELFWRDGYEGLSVQTLCAAMGLNPGSLYAAWGDKRALYLAALERYEDTVCREAAATMEAERSGIAGLRAYFGHLVDGMTEGRRRWGCLFTNAALQGVSCDPEIERRVDAHFARLEALLDRALARAREDGEVAPAASGSAPYLVMVVQGLHVSTRQRPPRARLEAMVETALGALGSAPPRPPS